MGNQRAEEIEDVAATNRAFYHAFAEGDLAAMMEVWAHGAHVRCVHPGWPLLEGWERVRASWAQILTGPDAPLTFMLDDLQVRAAGDTAWVSCIERVRAPGVDAAMIATNVFERDAHGEWRMVQHHASPILGRRAEAVAEPGREPGPDDIN